MTRDDIFDQDRGEKQYYESASLHDEIALPLTSSGFEALLAVVCGFGNLPLDDAARAVLAGYIHHIPNEKNTTTLDTLGKMLHKSIANSTSWRIDQEIKIKRRAEIEAEQKKQEETKPPLAIVE